MFDLFVDSILLLWLPIRVQFQHSSLHIHFLWARLIEANLSVVYLQLRSIYHKLPYKFEAVADV